MFNVKTMLCLVLTLAVGLAFNAPATMAAGEVTKIGILDLQRAINTSKKGQSAKAKLSGKLERLQKELKSRESELESLQRELERQSSALSPEAKFEKEKTIKRKARDFQDLYRDYTQEMQKDEVETTQPIVNEIIKLAKELGKERGYTVILEVQKAGVVYAPGDLDVTEDVIRRLDGGK